MPYRQIIAEAYDSGVEKEFNRLTETPIREAEYKLIIELLDEYIPTGSVVIDIGAGPGRYAEYLIQQNCKVGLVDLSAKSLKAFSDRIKETLFETNILFNQVSCATQLNWIEDDAADAILLMGPMYHLINDEHRNIALTNCKRILKPGGFLFTVFLSPYTSGFIESESVSLSEIFKKSKDATISHTNFQGYNVPQFRCWPSAATDILKRGDFNTLCIRNIEGEFENIPGITQQYIIVSKLL